MSDLKYIHTFDLVRVWRDKATLQRERDGEEIRNVVAGCVGAFVVVLLMWLV